MRYSLLLLGLAISLNATELPEEVAPYIGPAVLPASVAAPHANRSGMKIYNKLPNYPFVVIGDVWVELEQTVTGNLEHAIAIAKLTPATALILATTQEVYQQQVKGRGDEVTDSPEIRAWLIQEIPAIDTIAQPSDRMYIQELAKIQQALDELELGRIPRGFTYPTYKALLERNRREVLAHLQHPTPN